METIRTTDPQGRPRRDRGRSSADAAPRLLVIYIAAVSLAVVVASGFVIAGLLDDSRAAADAQDVRVPVLRDAVRANPEDANIRRELAAVYQQNHLDRAALREYRKVLAGDEYDVGALYGTGVIYRRQGKERRAREQFERVLEVRPAHARASVALAEMHLESDEPDKALTVALSAVLAQPSDAYLHYLAAMGYQGAGDPAKAVEHYRQAVELDPDMIEASDALAELGTQW